MNLQLDRKKVIVFLNNRGLNVLSRVTIGHYNVITSRRKDLLLATLKNSIWSGLSITQCMHEFNFNLSIQLL